MREGSNCKIRSPDKFVELVMCHGGNWGSQRVARGARGGGETFTM